MKKTLKKLASLGLCAVMATAFLAGCSTGAGDKTSNGGKTTLSLAIWDEKQRPTMELLAQTYMEQNPEVSIEVQLTPYKGGEYWTKLEAAATGGKAPDVFWLNVLHLDSYVEGGILADLTQAVQNSDINEAFPESLVNNYVRDGKNYAVPKDFDTNALWYNKEIFDQAGVDYPTDDWTYDDLVVAAEQIKAANLGKGIYPFASSVYGQANYYQTVFANDGWIISDDKTESGYADPKTQEAIQWWIDVIDQELSPSAAALSEISADAMFEGQQLAMNFAGSYWVPSYTSNEAIKDKIDCVEIPAFNGKENNIINGLGYAVYEGSKNKDAATDLAIWLSSEEAMRIQGEAGVVISAREDAQDFFVQVNEMYNLAAYVNHADKAYPLPISKSAAELYDLEANALKKAYAGEITLKEACEQLKKDADALLAKDAK